MPTVSALRPCPRSIQVGEFEVAIRDSRGSKMLSVLLTTEKLLIVLLLCGGDKGSQDADIERAIGYWNDWQRRPVQ